MTQHTVEEVLFASAYASAHFAVSCLEAYNGNLRACSSFVTPEREIMHWHEFGDLEGPGWAANAVGGAHLLYRWGIYSSDTGMQEKAVSLLNHILQDGFVHEQGGLIWPYYDLGQNQFCWNYTHGMDWLCPGSLAKVGVQLLDFSQDLSDPELKHRMFSAAAGLGDWLLKHISILPNGWVPRRIRPDGSPFELNPNGRKDSIYDHSADGLFILQLWAYLARLGYMEYAAPARSLGDAFVNAGGWFGSINHDTYDDQESVAYACAFRILCQAADFLDRPAWRNFAYKIALPGLNSFRMLDDRHGLPTAGLLWMERSWNTAYLWENAEAAHAYLEAWAETGDEACYTAGIEILVAIAKHHHGDSGFMTEGVDWDNHVTRRHHIDGKLYEDIRYTEPLLNNLHVLGPTQFYLQRIRYSPPDIKGSDAISLVSDFQINRRQKAFPKNHTRYYIRFYFPAVATDERLSQALDFTRRSGADGVLLFESSYDMDPALLTLEQLKTRFTRLKEVVPLFREIVPEVHLNIMITLGHVDAGSAYPERFPFQFLINETGQVSRSTACPLDPKFLSHISQLYQMAAGTGAQVIWVDDDTRLLWHDIPGLTCFCPHHLSALNKVTNQTWHIDNLVAALQKDENLSLRQTWLDIQEKAFLELGEVIEQAVHNIDPSIRIGLMTVGQTVHAAEGRRTDRLLRVLAGGRQLLIRPGAGYWQDRTPGLVLEKTEGCARELDLIGHDVQAMAEIENHPYTPFGKSLRLLALEMGMNILCGIQEMTFNLLSSMGGSGKLEPEGTDYASFLREQKPFLDALAKDLKGKQRQGISILDHIDYARQAPLDQKGLSGLMQPRPWESVLAHMGFPLGRYDMGALGNDGPFWVTGRLINSLSDYDLTWYLRAGVVLDATASQELIKRGFGTRLGLLNILPMRHAVNEIYTEDPMNSEYQGVILPVYNHIPPKQLFTWELEQQKGRILSNWLDVNGRLVGPAVTLLETKEQVYSQAFTWKVMLLPYSLTSTSYELLNLPRRYQWTQALTWLGSKPLPCHVVRGTNILPYAYSHDSTKTFVVVNMSADEQLVELQLGSLTNGGWTFNQLDVNGDWKKFFIHQENEPVWKTKVEPFRMSVLSCTKEQR